MAVTLVPESLAQPGRRFAFRGPNLGDECRGCPFQRLCFGLAPGHSYEVVGVRDVTHPCNLHDGGRVRAVLVEPADFATSLETAKLRGTAATWTPVPCGRPDCAAYGLCHPAGPTAGARYAVTAEAGNLDCPAGFDLTRVRLKAL